MASEAQKRYMLQRDVSKAQKDIEKQTAKEGSKLKNKSMWSTLGVAVGSIVGGLVLAPMTAGGSLAVGATTAASALAGGILAKEITEAAQGETKSIKTDKFYKGTAEDYTESMKEYDRDITIDIFKGAAVSGLLAGGSAYMKGSSLFGDASKVTSTTPTSSPDMVGGGGMTDTSFTEKLIEPSGGWGPDKAGISVDVTPSFSGVDSSLSSTYSQGNITGIGFSEPKSTTSLFGSLSNENLLQGTQDYLKKSVIDYGVQKGMDYLFSPEEDKNQQSFI